MHKNCTYEVTSFFLLEDLDIVEIDVIGSSLFVKTTNDVEVDLVT